MDVDHERQPDSDGRGRGVVQSPSISAALPAWLAQYGYNFQLLKAGHNEIPVQVWCARAPPTPSRGRRSSRSRPWPAPTSRRPGPLRDARRRSSTRSRRWPRRRGRAGAGRCSSGRPGRGRSRRCRSAPAAGCSRPRAAWSSPPRWERASRSRSTASPGSFIADGSERVETAAAPFAAVDAPALSCLSALPTSGVRLEMADELTLARAYTGQPYAYAPAVSYRLTNAYLRSLFDAGRLAVGDNALSLTFTSAVDGAGSRAVLGGPTLGPVTVRVGAGAPRSGCSPRRVPARSSSPTTWPGPRD